MTEAQRLLRDQELQLMDYLRKQAEGRQGGGGGRGGRGGAAAGGQPAQAPIARFTLAERQTVAEFYQRCFGEELPESSAHVAIA